MISELENSYRRNMGDTEHTQNSNYIGQKHQFSLFLLVNVKYCYHYTSYKWIDKENIFEKCNLLTYSKNAPIHH